MMTLEQRAGMSGLKCQVCGDPLCGCECMFNGSPLRPGYVHERECRVVTVRGGVAVFVGAK